MTVPLSEIDCIPYVDQTRVTAQDVIALWTTEAGLSIQEAQRRLSELLLVAIGPGNELVGVSTAYTAYNEQLGLDLCHLRVFISERARLVDLGRRIALRAYDALRDRYLTGADTRGLGMLMVVQNQSFNRHHDLARWAASDLEVQYAGEDKYGNSLRVVYFPGTELPLPNA